MKTKMLLVVCASLLLAAGPALAQKWAEDGENVWGGKCYGRAGKNPYMVGMTVGLVAASPDIDYGAPRLAKPLADIIEAAAVQLEKAYGTRQGWTLSGVRLLRAERVPYARRAELARKWFYLVSFTDNGYGEIPAFAVTIDGRPGTVTTAADEAKKPRLPFK